MNIKISMESTCDLPQELIQKNNFSIIPYSIILGDEVINDNEKAQTQIFEYVKSTKKLPKTSAINQEQYENYFKKLSQECDAVIHITLSGELTSSVANATAASKQFNNVFVVDSKSLSTGIALLGLKAKELISEGLTAQEIVKKLNSKVNKVQASFIVERLDYLYKGGRCNAISLLGANLLKIRPQIIVENGKMKPAKKYRGKMDKVIADYCQDVLAENNADKSVAFITYTTATAEMIENAKSALKKANFKTIYETRAGGTITSHCGENVLGILFINK